MLCCNTPTLSDSSAPRSTNFSTYYSIMSPTLKFTLFTIFELTILLLHLKKNCKVSYSWRCYASGR